MAFSDTTFAKGAFKRLNALAHTANARDPANESILSQVIIQAAKATAAEAIANSQATAVAAGIVEVVTFDLTEVSGSNNLAFEAKFQSGYTGFFGAGAQGDLLRDWSFAIPKTFSSPILDVDTDGYNPILKNVTPDVIAAGDPCDWYWDETAGVVVCEDDAASGTDWPPATIKCCIYTGQSIAGTYRQSFVNGDLSTGVLTVTHNLGNQYGIIRVFDNNDEELTPDSVDMSAANSCTVDLSSFGTLSGTWNLVMMS